MPTTTSTSVGDGSSSGRAASAAEMVRMSSPENNGNGPSASSGGGHQSRDEVQSMEHFLKVQSFPTDKHTLGALLHEYFVHLL